MLTHNEMMKFKLTTLSFAVLILLPHTALPQRISGRFSTSVYAFEKFDTVNVSKVIARGFQTVLLDISEGNLSLHTSLYGATNISQSFGNDADIRVNNLFLRWKNIAHNVDMSIGRIPIFAGIGNGIVDGAQVKFRGEEHYITLVGYGGVNVHAGLKSTGTNNVDKNYLLGGQIIAHVFHDSRIGVSYVNRRIERERYTALRPDSLFNPTPVVVTPDSRAEQALGIDARYAEGKDVTAFGRYDYDLNLKRSRRVGVGARAIATEQLAVTAEYIYREPRIFYNSFFTVFPTAPVREYEGGIEYQILSSLRTFARIAYVQYEGDASRRVTVGFNHDFGSLTYSGTNGYAGELSSFSAQSTYPLFNRRVIPTVGFSFAAFRLDEHQNTREDIFAGSLGVVVRPMPVVSGDIQVQWLRNTVVENDVRLFAKISYWFNHNLNLFGNHKETE